MISQGHYIQKARIRVIEYRLEKLESEFESLVREYGKPEDIPAYVGERLIEDLRKAKAALNSLKRGVQ